MKGIVRFGNGQRSPIYIGPYEIVKCIREVAYELDLPLDLATIYPVFMCRCSEGALGPICDWVFLRVSTKKWDNEIWEMKF